MKTVPNTMNMQIRGLQKASPKDWRTQAVMGASSVEILVFASPTGYIMLTSFSFPLSNWGIFCKLL